MKVMKWSAIALAVAAGTTQVQMAAASAQSDSKGFVEDSSLSILARNLYFSRDFRNNPSGPDSQSRAAEWGQGFIGTFESGFTQGTIGVGFDAIGLMGIKLDSGRGTNGTGLFPTGSDGRSEDEYAELGGAVKARFSNTVVKYGDQFTTMPVFATDDSRLLPEVAEGGLITSQEIEGLTLNVGRFTGINAQAQTYHDSLRLPSANVAGGTYEFSKELTATLYYSKVEDYWRKIYAGATYSLALSDSQGIVFDFNMYDTKSDGSGEVRAYDGDKLDNRIFSLQAAYSIGPNTFTVAHQRVSGDGDYAYGIDGGGSVFVANSIARSDFNAEDEKSWQLRYDLNMATLGVPGLSFMTRYVKGTDANTTETSNGKEWERDIEAKYVFQSGPAKDLSLRVRQATYRSADGVYYGSSSIDELRLIVQYPLSIL